MNSIQNEFIKDALENTNQGIKINGENINNLRYADDTILLADSIGILQELLCKDNKSSEECGLTFNVNNTKHMVIRKN